MDEFGLVWMSSVWFDEVDFLKCSRSASQLSFTNLFLFRSKINSDAAGLAQLVFPSAIFLCGSLLALLLAVIECWAQRPDEQQ